MQIIVLLVFAGLPGLVLWAIDVLYARRSESERLLESGAAAKSQQLAERLRNTSRLALVVDNERREAASTN